MFKVPDWGEDIPKSNASFERKAKKKEKAVPQITKPVQSNKVNVVAKKKYFDSPKANKHVPRGVKKTRANKLNPRVLTPKPTARANNTPKINNGNRAINKSMENNNVKNLRKRKLEKSPIQTKQKSKKTIEEPHMFNTDIPDEVLINVKKQKLNEALQNDDKEELLFKDKAVKRTFINNDNGFTRNGSNKINNKKEKLKILLESNRTPINVTGNKLRNRMLDRLKAAQFRYLNEKLYTSSGSEAHQLFQSDPAAFQTYHQGYQLQVKKWPVNPLDVIVKKIVKMPKSYTIADMGCGEAALRRRVSQSVRSFDLVGGEGVEECDMAHTPLLAGSVDVAVYCLALMGTQLTQYLVEANRVLRMGGHLLIAEVESRFDNLETFTNDVQRLGFKLKNLDKSHKVFFFMEFIKIRDPPAKKAKIPEITLKPCLYKRR